MTSMDGDGSAGDHDAHHAGERSEPAMRPVPRPRFGAQPDRQWSRESRNARRVRLTLGIALVAVLGAAWALVGRTAPGARPRASQPPLAAAPSTVPPWVPAALASTCRATESRALGVVVECTPGRGVIALQYRGFVSVGALRAAYAAAAPRGGGVGPAACAQGSPEERSWSTAVAPAVARGRYRCSRVDGRARVVWTNERAGVLGSATRADGDLRSLYQWWTTVPGPVDR
jgi:hypothetical protein